MKGILLAGGNGSRLHPLTIATSKQLLPVYNKPMIYYPMSVLMLAGIREILIISTARDLPAFQRLFDDGSQLGLTLEYRVQDTPRGIADAFVVGRSFVGDDRVALALGDNIFYGQGFQRLLQQAASRDEGATVFAYPVRDPENYGVVSFSEDGVAIDIEEKPQNPKSRFVVPGLYFYDNRVLEISANLEPSQRGELEISDINREYLKAGKLHVEKLSRGFAWLDTGTHEALLQAANFVQTLEQRQGLRIACLEEIAFLRGFINRDQLKKLSDQSSPEIRKYLNDLIRV